MPRSRFPHSPIRSGPLAVAAVAALLSPLGKAADSAKAETNSIGQRLVLLEGGRFVQGTDARENGLQRAFPLHVNAQYFGNPETPAHVTWITKPFWMGATEVTVGQWKAFTAATSHVTTAEKNGEGIIGWSPTPAEKPLYQSHDFERKSAFTWRNPGFPQADDHPVVGVSWEDIRAFLQWLSQKEGVTYRLPTEAEWEFACRAGSEAWFSFGDEPRGVVHRHANLANVELEKHRRHSAERQWLLDWDREPPDGHVFTAPVGSFEPNAFGLHDLHGNVWEWCADLWLDTFYLRYDWPERGKPRQTAVDPVNESEPQTDTNRFRAIRGGSWYNGPVIARSSARTYWDEPDAACYLGFRVVREADPSLSTTARDARIAETRAREAIEQAGGTLWSSQGLKLEARFETDSLDAATLESLARLPGIDSLVIGNRKPIAFQLAHFEAIASLSSLRSIDFRGAIELPPTGLHLLSGLTQLESLSFGRSSPLNDAHLASLGELKSLTTFRCYGTSGGLTDAGIRSLAANRGLKILELNEADSTGEFLSAFDGCPLDTIAITKPYGGEARLTDAFAARLALFPELRVVRLNEQGQIGDQTLSVLGGLAKLEELTLQGCGGITAQGFAPLGKLTKLRSLNLQSTAAGDEAVAALREIPRLQSLRLGSETLTDPGFAALADVFSIENLHIENSNATDEGLKHLGRINRLKQLDLGSPRITGTGLGPIARLPALNDLKLRCPALTDVVFDHLARAKSLRKLRLVERGWQPPAALTDAGLLRIAPAIWLTELWLPRNDSGITEAGIEALKPLMPKTGVIPYSVEWRKGEGN